MPSKTLAWTLEEVRILRSLYADPSKDFTDIRRAFPARTEHSIRCKASELGIRRPIPGEATL